MDYFFMDKRLIPHVHSCTYQGIVISDHAPVVMSLSLPDIPQPIRRWRFNSSLLSDSKFVKFIEERITFFLETNNTSNVSGLMVWDALKAYLREQIISFTANKKSHSEKERLVLASEILDIDNQYALTQTPELYNKRLELQTKFDLLTTH